MLYTFDTIDIVLDVGKETVKIYINDLGIERGDDFSFKDKTEINREIDYTRVVALNSTLITLKN